MKPQLPSKWDIRRVINLANQSLNVFPPNVMKYETKATDSMCPSWASHPAYVRITHSSHNAVFLSAPQEEDNAPVLNKNAFA